MIHARRPVPKTAYELETGAGIYVDDGLRFPFYSETSVHIFMESGFQFHHLFETGEHEIVRSVSKLQQFWKPASAKYWTLVSKTLPIWTPQSEKYCTVVPKHFKLRSWCSACTGHLFPNIYLEIGLRNILDPVLHHKAGQVAN